MGLAVSGRISREPRPRLRLVKLSHWLCVRDTAGLMAALAFIGVAKSGADLVTELHMGLVALEAGGGMRRVRRKTTGSRECGDDAGRRRNQRLSHWGVGEIGPEATTPACDSEFGTTLLITNGERGRRVINT